MLFSDTAFASAASGTISPIFLLILQSIAAILVAIIVAWVGLLIYHKQKEYELIKKRYLEGAIDVVVSNLEDQMNGFWHNWSRSLYLLKLFRDTQRKPELRFLFNVSELRSGFAEIGPPIFTREAWHRIFSLVRTDLIWESYQLSLAFVSTANEKTTYEIPFTIRAQLHGALDADIMEIHNDLVKELTALEEQAHRYAVVTQALQIIAFEVERNPPKLMKIRKYLDNFHTREKVKEALGILRSEFGKELKQVQFAHEEIHKGN